MSEANKQVLEKANAAIVQGDYEGFLAWCTEDTAWTFEGERTLNGKESVRQWMASAYTEPPTFKLDQLIADGDFVAALGEIMVKDEQGRSMRHSYCDVWRFENGKIAQLRAFVVKVAPFQLLT